MLRVKHHLHNLMRCEVNDSRTASFWNDTWTDGGPLLSLLGSSGPRQLSIPRSATVSQAIENGDWRFPGARTDEAMHLQVELTARTPPRDEDGSDVYLWRNAAGAFTRVFSSRDTWNFIRVPSHVVPWHKSVWFKQAIPRCSLISWLVLKERLPTKDRLRNWGLMVPSQCVLCSNALETHDHLFFCCSYSAEVWSHFASAINRPYPQVAQQAALWTLQTHHRLQVPSDSLSVLAKVFLQVNVFHLWRERNSRIFKGISNSVTSLRKKIDRTIVDRLLSLKPARPASSSLLLHYLRCMD